MNQKRFIIGLCGTSGSGKTLTCQSLVKELRCEGVTSCGFISPAVFENTEKTSIKVQWLESGEERILLTPLTDASELAVGRWQIHADAFAWIDQKLKGLQTCQAFMCDEIGPLEVLEGKGWVKALDIVDEGKFGLYVITFRPSLREYLEQRFPDMTVYDLDQKDNHENVILDVKKFFGID